MNLKQHAKVFTQLSIWLSFFAVGIPYWMMEYSQLTLPNGLVHIGLSIPFLATVIARGFISNTIADAALPPGAAIVAVVVTRIVIDIFLVPDSHNLWPFELIIASVVALGTTVFGGLVGAWLNKLVDRTNPDGPME